MPSVENHVNFCVKKFGGENRELCYMVNSWMDAPSRNYGSAHRVYRHDLLNTPLEACQIYGDGSTNGSVPFTPKNQLITKIVLQHLMLDGLIEPWQANYTLEDILRLRKQALEHYIKHMIEHYKRDLDIGSILIFFDALLLCLLIGLIDIPAWFFLLCFFSFLFLLPLGILFTVVGLEYFTWKQKLEELEAEVQELKSPCL